MIIKILKVPEKFKTKDGKECVKWNPIGILKKLDNGAEWIKLYSSPDLPIRAFDMDTKQKSEPKQSGDGLEIAQDQPEFYS